MAHSHSHEGDTYYLDQLATIGVCGALGGVSIMLYQQDVLKYILAPGFHVPVLLGGIGLLVVVAIRAATLWIEMGKVKAAHSHDHDGHHHDHAHGPDCDHDHAHEHVTAAVPLPVVAHDHHHHGDDGHDHGWAPWRYAVLLLPIVLYFLNLPNAAFSGSALQHLSSIELQESGVETVKGESGAVESLTFRDLEKAAYDVERRRELQGKIGVLRGQLVPGSPDNTARLARFKITCCAADAIPLSVTVVAPESLTNYIQVGKWYEVQGQIQFRKRKGRDEYLPVLQIGSRNDLVYLGADPPEARDPYLQ